jgi:hypothetical protein
LRCHLSPKRGEVRKHAAMNHNSSISRIARIIIQVGG